jgi:hypothetical protein
MLQAERSLVKTPPSCRYYRAYQAQLEKFTDPFRINPQVQYDSGGHKKHHQSASDFSAANAVLTFARDKRLMKFLSVLAWSVRRH